MHIHSIPNRSGGCAYLLRESYREKGKVKKRTLANLSRLPLPVIELIRLALQKKTVVPLEGLSIRRSLPHGHVHAVLGVLRKIGLERDLDREPSRMRNLAVGLIASRLLRPASKRSTAAGLRRGGADTACSTLGAVLGIEDVGRNEPYRALDWLGSRQDAIQRRLSRRHLADGCLVLYDVTSTYFEGNCCPLARHGYSRDHRPDRPQIVVGLLANSEGCPVAAEVFAGDTADPKTLGRQVARVRERFGLRRVAWVGDRGMISSVRIREELRGREGLEWITALRSAEIRRLAEPGTIQPSLFDQQDLMEVESAEYPGERLVVCWNPRLAQERARKREVLLAETEARLLRVREAVEREKRPLQNHRAIVERVTRILDRHKMGKHFDTETGEGRFTFARREERIAAEAALDGLYVIRTSLGKEAMDAGTIVETYKRLAKVERAFRQLKHEDDLHLRPIFHWREDRVRAHVFLCMLACYLEWHLRRDLAPLLFHDEHPPPRSSPVQPPLRSQTAARKASSGKTANGLPVLPFRDLLNQLGTLTRNRVVVDVPGALPFDLLSRPTPLQNEAFRLLGLKPPSR